MAKEKQKQALLYRTVFLYVIMSVVNMPILGRAYCSQCQFHNRVTMKCKYRVRWFSSKGAFLVLLWTLLVVIDCSLLAHFVFDDHYLNYEGYDSSIYLNWSLSIPTILMLVSGPLSGWLADAKLGNYKVFQVGAMLLFISAVINCLFMISVNEQVFKSNYMLKCILLVVILCFFSVGSCACLVTALPLGLDQMPDASSSRITSYIAWFVCSLLLGNLPGEVLDFFKENGSFLLSVLCFQQFA